MLKKTMTKAMKIPVTVWQKLTRCFRPEIKVKLTRKNLIISLPASQGGALHMLPRPGTTEAVRFAVEQSEGMFALQMAATGQTVSLATFSGEHDAQAALSKVNKALTGNQLVKWSVRIFVLWIVWLLVTSYLQVSQQAHAEGVASSAPAAFTPPPGTGFQPFPSVAAAVAPQATSGNLADEIYQAAMQAKTRAEHENMPPKVNDNTAGLDGFGLDSGASQAGPGCDPKLAFKVEQK
ncbi:serpin family protein [Cupriavidus pinatubonensis]|uniref:Uncharacterized protein n=1 Tax=Cupriavidus pinatubonensis TaxID=248026 RepID=A0ABN7YB23_9BURK|nr:hypothetical protein [Cupriavidus pinatubonensis]CAG9169769.1 hypothetical protein LMG23994_01654 [Cupriavidus pinatubonensis]